MAIACGENTTIVVGEYGNVFTFGDNVIPNNKAGTIQTMKASFRNKEVVMASIGRGHKACITSDGILWTWGTSLTGESGHGDCKTRERPQIIPRSVFDGSSAVMVSCGINHMMVLTAERVVFTCGSNSYGQLGLGSCYDHDELTKIKGFFGVCMVACGSTFSMAVTINGRLYSWGNNQDAQLGHNDYIQRISPTIISSHVFAGNAVESVSAGKFHAAAVTTNGDLYLWGANNTGQLGMDAGPTNKNPTILSVFNDFPVSTVTCCERHTMVVLRNGALWTFGISKPTLGHNKATGVPTRVDANHFNNAKIVCVAGGEWHSVAVTDTGDLYTWGVSNALGYADDKKTYIPTRVVSSLLGNSRVGCFHDLLPEHALAFVMCQHKRLGEGSMYMELEPEIIMLIIELCMFQPQHILHKMPGLARMLGFGSMLS